MADTNEYNANGIPVTDSLDKEDDGIQRDPSVTGQAMHAHNSILVEETNIGNVFKANEVIEEQDEDLHGSDSLLGPSVVSNESHEWMSIDVGKAEEVNEVNKVITPETNPQMAVFPLNDPNIAKTSDDIRDITGQEIDDYIAENNDLINAASDITNEGIAPVHSVEDLTYGNLIRDNRFLTQLEEAVSNNTVAFEDILDSIKDAGGISKEHVIAIESLQPGLITGVAKLNSFTNHPSRTNLTVSTEAVQSWLLGAKIAAGVAIFAILVKAILFIRKKLGGHVDISNSAVTDAKEKAGKTTEKLNNIVNDHSNKLKADPKLNQQIKNKIKSVTGKEFHNLDLTKLEDINNVLVNNRLFKKLGKYNKLAAVTLANKDITPQLTNALDSLESIIDKIGTGIQGLEHLVNSPNASERLEESKYKSNWDDYKKYLKALGLPSDFEGKSIHEALNPKLEAMRNEKAEKPSFQELSAFKMDVDALKTKAETIGKKLETKGLVNKIDAMAKKFESIQEEALKKDRLAQAKSVKNEVYRFLAYQGAISAIQNRGEVLSKIYVETINEVEKDWKDIFKGTSIEYPGSK